MNDVDATLDDTSLTLSGDAVAFLALLTRSRTEQPPKRLQSRKVAASHARNWGLVPLTRRSGVSRDDIRDRLRLWDIDWTYARLTVVVDELVASGHLARGDRGIYALL